MKKNIIIAGVPRAGKSTISNIISKRFGYHHISMDSIIAGFERVFPENGIDTNANLPSSDILRNISGKIAPFINAMIDSGEYDEYDEGMVIDVYQLLPEDYMKYIDSSRCDIFYFVTADVSADERFLIFKNYDTPKDYTYYHPESELRKSCAEIVDNSKYLRKECLKYNVPCFETSKNREIVINTFINDLKFE